ncbi:hypothetical protein CGMCC3_g6677 [Colletotrichum fructicola]|nr:uncharacterized protein CGMCC3_g6677 [Colletotrichum fructicola]KAE9577461.1 hypothetical protein CGMCC3_g6677 [Colletotrichum fructicola]
MDGSHQGPSGTEDETQQPMTFGARCGARRRADVATCPAERKKRSMFRFLRDAQSGRAIRTGVN